MLRILRAWDSQNLVLFLGAGVSIPYGLPNWNDLVLDLLMNKSGIPREDRDVYGPALGACIERLLRYSPTALARVIKKDGELPQSYLNRIRDALYATPKTPAAGTDTLSAVADLIASARTSDGFAIRGVVTSNFDDLLESELTRRGIPIDVIYQRQQRPTGTGLPIYHIHGYMPQDIATPDGQRGGRNVPLDQRIVFTEDEYHDLTYTAFQWATIELTHFMRTATILFIGCSMADPNIRRLLDATAEREPRHFVFRVVRPLTEGERLRVARTTDAAEIVDSAYREALRHDAEALEQLGVMLVPVPSYEDIALKLRLLGAPRDTARPVLGPRLPTLFARPPA